MIQSPIVVRCESDKSTLVVRYEFDESSIQTRVLPITYIS